MQRMFKEGDIVKIISLPSNFDSEYTRHCIGKIGPIDEQTWGNDSIYLIDNNKYGINFLAENLESVSHNLEKIMAEMETAVQDYENKLKTK